MNDDNVVTMTIILGFAIVALVAWFSHTEIMAKTNAQTVRACMPRNEGEIASLAMHKGRYECAIMHAGEIIYRHNED